MTIEVRVPTLGESVTEATVATWFKKPGDAVAVDEMLCELETDKVTVEVPSPAAGVMGEIVAAEGETVGYGNSWTARRPSRIATVAAGYADGLHRAIGGGIDAFAGGQPCPVVGRISMDLITVDVTDLPEDPERLRILNGHQTVDDLAEAAGTIGYEILSSLGSRYSRGYVE